MCCRSENKILCYAIFFNAEQKKRHDLKIRVRLPLHDACGLSKRDTRVTRCQGYSLPGLLVLRWAFRQQKCFWRRSEFLCNVSERPIWMERPIWSIRTFPVNLHQSLTTSLTFLRSGRTSRDCPKSLRCCSLRLIWSKISSSQRVVWRRC